MNIQEFADRYGIRARKDSCGDDIIPGFQAAKDMPKRMEYRNHIYDNGNGQFGVCLMATSSNRITFALKRLVAAGFVVGQDGYGECTALFDPANEQQARMAMAECQINPIRKATAAQQAALQHARTLRRPPLTALMGNNERTDDTNSQAA